MKLVSPEEVARQAQVESEAILSSMPEDALMNMDVEDPKDESLLIDSKEESLRINQSNLRMNIPDLDISGENLPT